MRIAKKAPRTRRTARVSRRCNSLVAALAVALALIALPVPLFSGGLPPAEKQKIEALISRIREMREASFVRNGRVYDAETAATFLSRKWRANESRVSSARDFVEKIASFSGTSGKPYKIRHADGTEITSRDFLLAALDAIEQPAVRIK